MFVDIHIHCFRLLLTFCGIDEKDSVTVKLSYHGQRELFTIYSNTLCLTP